MQYARCTNQICTPSPYIMFENPVFLSLFYQVTNKNSKFFWGDAITYLILTGRPVLSMLHKSDPFFLFFLFSYPVLIFFWDFAFRFGLFISSCCNCGCACDGKRKVYSLIKRFQSFSNHPLVYP